jgi:hypothetical protein
MIISLVYDHNSAVIIFGGLAPPAALVFMDENDVGPKLVFI